MMEVDTSSNTNVDKIGNGNQRPSKEHTTKSSKKRPADDVAENRNKKRDNKTQHLTSDTPKNIENNHEVAVNNKNDETTQSSQAPADTTAQTSASLTQPHSAVASLVKVGNGTPSPTQIQERDQTPERELNKFREFDKFDRAPYKMFLQNADNSEERINPLLINKFLIEKFQNSDVFDECYPLAQNKVCIVAKSLKTANEVLKLTKWGAANRIIFIPNHLMTRQGIIKNIPTKLSENEILQNLEANGPRFGTVGILSVRRFTRRNVVTSTGKPTTPIPTRTVQVTFRGQ
ncbi:hypothetical protein QAD02_022228 [Eretmocerus hayati]|uniref:Uncharacterized protein n=1 Tax=Eretmocerus hayati TaxID=131215 RepID=A0ACC2PUX3_9HYME|nr:hypothetical protein QAD02_022228 [Eretmocerus hayati]